jgi:hypothetical protein
MSYIKLLPLKIIFVLALAALVVGFITCSDDKTNNPADQYSDYENLYMELFNVADADSVEIITVDSASSSLTLQSGSADSAEVTIEGESNFIIAYDSTISDTVDIEIESRMLEFVQGSDSSRKTLVFICAPEGQVFENGLIFDIYPAYFNNHPTSNVVRLYALNPAGNWNVISTQHKSASRLRYAISHFSKYAIAD